MGSDAHPDLDRATCSAALAAFIAEARDLRLAAAADPVIERRRANLRAWQAARLARTHADLLASERYGEAAAFFLSDLYGPKDFGERDSELERILPLMTTILPVSGLRTLLLAIEVDALSERLDAAMVGVLGARLDAPDLSDNAYASAYREVGDRPGRETQIRLIGETGEALDAFAQKPFVRMTLKMMLRTVIRITDGFFSFFGRRSVTSVRLTSSPSRQASAAASRVMSTNTATTSSSVKDQERWMTLRENTFPTVSTRISSVEITRTIFSTEASAFMIFL